MSLYGTTRSNVEGDHALITPDTHVLSVTPGWVNTDMIVSISPALGARFCQYLARMGTHAQSAMPADGVQRFFYVESGVAELEVDGQAHILREGSYAYLPPNLAHEIRTGGGSADNPIASLVIFEKLYAPSYAHPVPGAEVKHREQVPAEPYLGDPDALLQTFLPEDPSFDMAVNLFTFKPGAHLPCVEVHIMEHGLIFLEGQGVYRLAERWYPVQKGDIIWMASFCPQWFTANGKTPSSYLYYKDVNRDPMNEESGG